LTYEGAAAGLKTKALTSAALAGLLRPMLQDVNVVSAPVVAKERGIIVEETTREAAHDYDSLITVRVETEMLSRHVSGTVFADGRPRIVNIKGIRMDAEFGPSMIYITNQDKPGFIGKFSSTLGDAGINIATFHVGREAPGGNAVALIEVDGDVPPDVLAKVQALPQVQQARPLKFGPPRRADATERRPLGLPPRAGPAGARTRLPAAGPGARSALAGDNNMKIPTRTVLAYLALVSAASAGELNVTSAIEAV